MPGTIIVVNGTSSSGKTSLVRALQARLDEPYLDLGIDRFIFALPGRYLERPLWDDVLGRADRAGATGEALVSAMHHAIAAAAQAGMNFIADHVLVEQRWVEDAARLFCELPASVACCSCSNMAGIISSAIPRTQRLERGRRHRQALNDKLGALLWLQPGRVHLEVVGRVLVDDGELDARLAQRAVLP